MHRIIVVGASEFIADMLERAVQDLACELVFVRPRESDIGRNLQQRPDFAIIDVTETTLDTATICDWLRRGHAELLTLLLSPEGTRLSQGVHININLVQPFTARKLSNRIKKMLSIRRTQPLTVGCFTLDPEKRRVSHRDKIVRLTPKEYRLLEFLARNAGNELTRKEIMREVWETDYMGDTRTLDVHIRWLREKIEAEPRTPVYIRTIRRVGYVFHPDALEEDETEDSP